jgi:hypothetical protein
MEVSHHEGSNRGTTSHGFSVEHALPLEEQDISTDTEADR